MADLTLKFELNQSRNKDKNKTSKNHNNFADLLNTQKPSEFNSAEALQQENNFVD